MICNSLVFIPVPLVVQIDLLKQLQCNSQGQTSSNRCILLHGRECNLVRYCLNSVKDSIECLTINILSFHQCNGKHKKTWPCIWQQCTVAGKKLTVTTFTCQNGWISQLTRAETSYFIARQCPHSSTAFSLCHFIACWLYTNWEDFKCCDPFSHLWQHATQGVQYRKYCTQKMLLSPPLPSSHR